MAIRLPSAKLAPVKRSKLADIKPASTRKRNKLRMLLAVGCLGFFFTTSSGCQMMSGACRAVKKSDRLDKFMIGYRNKVLAAKAWHREKHCYANRKNLRDYQTGFFQGYMDVASGSDGCIPAVAPSSYLGWRYQSPDGQARVNAWFAGYPMGVRAAEKDGVGNWGQVRPIGLEQACANADAFMPQMLEEGEAHNPFYEEVQQEYVPAPQNEYVPVPQDNVYSEPAPIEHLNEAVETPFTESPSDVEVVPDLIPEALDSPAIPADTTPVEATPDAATDASTGFGLGDAPIAGVPTEDLVPNQLEPNQLEPSELVSETEPLPTGGLIPSATVGDLSVDESFDAVFDDAQPAPLTDSE